MKKRGSLVSQGGRSGKTGKGRGGRRGPVEVTEGFVSEYEQKVGRLFSTAPLATAVQQIAVDPQLMELVRQTILNRKSDIDNYLQEHGRPTLSTIEVSQMSHGHLLEIHSDYLEQRAKTNIFEEKYEDVLPEDDAKPVPAPAPKPHKAPSVKIEAVLPPPPKKKEIARPTLTSTRSTAAPRPPPQERKPETTVTPLINLGLNQQDFGTSQQHPGQSRKTAMSKISNKARPQYHGK